MTGSDCSMLLVRPPGVYRAQEDTSLLREVLRRHGQVAGRSVLDVGSGTGALGIEACRAGAAELTAIDLSRRSVIASWLNSRLHGFPATVRRGDLFAPVAPRRFDLVLPTRPTCPPPICCHLAIGWPGAGMQDPMGGSCWTGSAWGHLRCSTQTAHYCSCSP